MRFHRGSDGWGRDSYSIPNHAVAGSSDCGSAPDSPAPTSAVKAELDLLRTALKAQGVRSRLQYTTSGNVCRMKRWVVVGKADYTKAKTLAASWLTEHKKDTRHIHDAD